MCVCVCVCVAFRGGDRPGVGGVGGVGGVEKKRVRVGRPASGIGNEETAGSVNICRPRRGHDDADATTHQRRRRRRRRRRKQNKKKTETNEASSFFFFHASVEGGDCGSTGTDGATDKSAGRRQLRRPAPLHTGHDRASRQGDQKVPPKKKKPHDLALKETPP